MKKLLLFVVMAIIAISIKATEVNVHLQNGKNIKGVLVDQTDSTLIVRPYNMPDGMFLKPELVKSYRVSGVGVYEVADGKFVLTSTPNSEKEQKAQEKDQRNRVLAANPYEVISSAFKSSGVICMSVGVPMLFAGTILVGVGNSGDYSLSKANCATAGYVLMSTGAALTIVGVPLFVHGKRIAELKFNYTGNGAGLAVNF